MNGPEDPSPADICSCPQCGVSDTYANIIEEVKAYATEHVARGLQSQMKDIVAGSKSMTYKPGHIETRNYRFVLSE
ncbi:hypothetical protein IC762_22385 [Bradyrhizobium genosp. L]|uniref:hypothetical protein n=1 Tax=Bradyrhizobium genosp. L TaxID=83637 RepID=UPI0018A333A8|nr:hypothetical protein [Bradyrhizobium genosp. L]QPF82498.1 hypothetical protein IC762_22385 [Bradyrhizobium genosp. L]